MFKFLRKYNKWILSVGGVLLMITFLIPQAFTSMGNGGARDSTEIARVGDNERVTLGQLRKAQSQIKFMEDLSRRGNPITFPGLGVITNPLQWLLLSREADQAGLVRHAMLSQDQLTGFAMMTGQGDPDFIRSTIGSIMGVSELLDMYVNSAEYSDRRLKTFAEQQLHSVNAQVVPLEASADGSQLTPTEEELAAHLAKFADKLPGEGEMGLGYKLPNRLKLEWLTISADAVRKAAEKSPEFSRVAQFKHWIRNEPKTFPPVPAGDATTAAVPEEVSTDLLDRLIKQKIEEITKFASDQLRLNRRGLAEAEGFVVTPEDWAQRMLKLDLLAQEIQKQYGVDLPAYESSGDKWLTIQEAAATPGLGGAKTDKLGSTAVDLRALLAAAKEFGGDGKLPVQKDIAAPPLTDDTGNIYVFRIIDASAAHAPTSVDEVRDSLVKDLKRIADYERLAASADQLKAQAVKDGLLALAVDHDNVVQQAPEVTLCNRRFLEMQLNQAQNPNQQIFVIPGQLSVVGSNKEAIEAVVNYALTLPMDKPASELTEDQRIIVVPVKDKLAVLVVRIMSQSPLTRELYTRLASTGQLQRLITREEVDTQKLVADAFSFEALSKRLNFVQKKSETTEEDGEVPAEPKTASAG